MYLRAVARKPLRRLGLETKKQSVGLQHEVVIVWMNFSHGRVIRSRTLVAQRSGLQTVQLSIRITSLLPIIPSGAGIIDKVPRCLDKEPSYIKCEAPQ